MEYSKDLHNHQFNGWWHNTTIGSMNAFNAGGPFGALQDNYIYIDTSVYPVQIYTTYGTERFPLLKPIGDSQPVTLPKIPNVPTGNSYFYKTSTELINGYNAPKYNTNPDLSIIYGNTLKLINNNTMHTFLYENPDYFGTVGLCIYKRSEKPKDTSHLNWNDPVNLFKYYISANRFSNVSTNPDTKEQNYVGKEREMEITKLFLNQGFKRKTLLRKIRMTNKKYYKDIGIANDAWTTIYTGHPKTETGIFSYVTPGSNVMIKGASGRLAILNGIYYNGVGLLNAGANLLLKPEFVDKGQHGSYNDLFNSFLLDINTSSLGDLADPNTGWIDLPDGITVTVKHVISSKSTYNELCAACAAWVYKVFRTATHVERDIYTYKESCKLIDSFSNLRKGLKDGSAMITFQDSMRYGQPCPSWYYHNFYDYRNIISGLGIEKSGGLQNMVNCPHPVNYNNPLFKYDVILGNYLINVHYLVFTIRGVLEKDQPHPKTLNYPFIYDKTAGRAHFESKLVSAKVVNGVIQVYVPKNYATMGSYDDDLLNINAHYFGQINPLLTGNKVVGYLYKRDCRYLDPKTYMLGYSVYNADYANKSNPRIYRESLSAVYSKMMKWFNKIKSDTIIIDQCGNLGGSADMLSIAEFMGEDRKIVSVNSVHKKHDIINYKIDTVCNASAEYQEGQYLYVSLNEKLYPGSVFRGKVIFLTDIFARSAGDISPNYFIGEEYVSIVGCLDGREFSQISVFNSFPLNINKKYASGNFINSQGQQVSPFYFNMDWGRYFLFYDHLSMVRQHKQIQPSQTAYRGTSGSDALPISFEETVFPDFGFTSSNRSTPGWKKLHPKKKSTSDPTTWTCLYLDAAISLL